MIKYILSFIFILTFAFSHGQADSTNLLSSKKFIQIVMDNHPIVNKSQLLEALGRLDLLAARGGFDPKLASQYETKELSGKRYYSENVTGLSVPTWYGIEGHADFVQGTGTYINPEAQTGANGLLQAGVSVNLGKGMFIDERRKALLKGKLAQELSETEQFLAVNEVLYDAIGTYWDWVIAYNHLLIYQNSVKMAEIRFEGVKHGYYQGVEPAIDTLEALILLQNRQLSLLQADLEYNDARIKLNNFMWTKDLQPLEIDSTIVAPEILDEFHNYLKLDHDLIEGDIQTINNHPIQTKYELKLKSLNVDRRYHLESFKPKLAIKYNLLNEPTNQYLPTSPYTLRDYKMGIAFSMPLFFREQRANYKRTKVNILEIQYEQQQKMRDIHNKNVYYHNEIENLHNQEELVTKNTVNYERIVEAEKRKFEIGESSLFLINSRENKLINSQIKLIDLRGKFQKSVISLQYFSGVDLFKFIEK